MHAFHDVNINFFQIIITKKTRANFAI